MALVLGLGASVRADAPNADEAFTHYEAARRHFEAHDYPSAIHELEQARTLDPTSANLVYNLAKAHRMNGDGRTALAFYKEYAAMVPEGSDEELEAKEIIAELEAELARDPASLSRREPTVAPVREERAAASSDVRPTTDEVRGDDGMEAEDDAGGGWVTPALFVTSGVLVAGGVVFGVMALGKQSDADAATTRAAYDDASSSRTTLALVSDGCFVGAAVLAGVALYLWLSDDGEGESQEAEARPVTPWFAADSHSAELGIRGAW
ncbi:MAG: hypothetical protein R3A78_10290 [Polyangiales bacterium]|nr:hypothetical protein [Myxococcales bacterium]